MSFEFENTDTISRFTGQTNSANSSKMVGVLQKIGIKDRLMAERVLFAIAASAIIASIIIGIQILQGPEIKKSSESVTKSLEEMNH